MFINNKYTTIYYNIIKNASLRNTDGYVERHHIIPKCMGGTNDKSNIVKLTAREHFICHRLLIKMVTDEYKHKLVFAAWQQSRSAKYHNVVITSRTYEFLKQQLSSTYKGKKRPPLSAQALHNRREAAKNRKKTLYTDERLEKLRILGKQHKGRTLTDDHKQKMSNALIGRKLSDDHKHKISQSKLGTTHSTESIEKMKATIAEKYPSGRLNGMQDKKHSDAALIKMRKAKEGVVNSHRLRSIVCTTTNERFESVKSAAVYFNIPSPYISAVLTGLQASTKGLVFAYI